MLYYILNTPNQVHLTGDSLNILLYEILMNMSLLQDTQPNMQPKSKAPQAGISVQLASFVTLVVASIAFVGGWAISGDKTAIASHLPAFVAGALIQNQEPEDVDFSPVWKAWHMLDKKFVPAALGTTSVATSTSEDRVWGMIQGLTSSLGDPYTVFMPPVEAQEFQEDISGTFEGVGMEIDVRDGVLIVVSPLKDSPAGRSGIQAKDLILEIDGESTEGISVGSAVKKIRGPRGSVVVLGVLHEGAQSTEDVSITRDVINFPTIETEDRGDGIFVISLYSFTAQSPNLFRGAIQEFIDSGSSKLILDLRSNPGGYLEAAVDMASFFLPSGKVVVTEDFGNDGKPSIHRSRGYDIFKDNPIEMVILVNKGSASASEILAGALNEYDIATIIGTNTFGKGSVQELVSITSDTSLKVTVARWLLPGDVWIPSTGIIPDIESDLTVEDYKAEKDPQMDRAVKYLNTGQ